MASGAEFYPAGTFQSEQKAKVPANRGLAFFAGKRLDFRRGPWHDGAMVKKKQKAKQKPVRFVPQASPEEIERCKAWVKAQEDREKREAAK